MRETGPKDLGGIVVNRLTVGSVVGLAFEEKKNNSSSAYMSIRSLSLQVESYEVFTPAVFPVAAGRSCALGYFWGIGICQGLSGRLSSPKQPRAALSSPDCLTVRLCNDGAKACSVVPAFLPGSGCLTYWPCGPVAPWPYSPVTL